MHLFTSSFSADIIGIKVFFSSPEPSLAVMQQVMKNLLHRVEDPLAFEDLKSMATTFDTIVDTTIYKYEGAAATVLMKDLNDYCLLEHDQCFSLFNTRQREEALMLFKVFMNCKSWRFYVGNAAFFREKMKEGEYVFAVNMAAMHPFGKGIVLPPMYQLIQF